MRLRHSMNSTFAQVNRGLVAFAAVLILAANALAQSEIVYGEAYNTDGQLEYIEKHVL